ncbi:MULTISPECIES: extensin family protein [Bradyrhizobium]|uniref:extensin-like domain-containing protein n=1 Tax=Bradyrhizobium TaxID=374 RepID=UPI00111D85EE|nr:MULTISPECIES: extensin family protein [Bradyrhizobium]QOZ27607.1 extensin [Bradyrhizobium sp. CCBAU 51753]
MTRGVRLYLVGSLVLVSLAGCGRGLFQTAEREPWRAEAEAACLKSGAVKEGPDLVRIDPISGPGVCGAEFPLKVAALGESSSAYGFADDSLRPPAAIGNQPRWPINRQPSPPPAQAPYPDQPQSGYGSQPGYGAQQSYGNQPNSGYGNQSNGPISLSAPGVPPQQDEIDLPPEGTPEPRGERPYYPGLPANPQRERAAAPYSPAPYSQQPADAAPPRLGPSSGNPVMAVGPVAVKPAATLACPIVSALERWLADSVQPAAQRWFGARVVEIKQISAYSCRGMNGNPHAHISEHAFGNALDIAAFTLADGRRIVVKNGWKGLPEEQGFLRDVQAAACQQFNTVLAPGSNVYHYDHIHVDLMRRASRRVICQPAAVSGDEVAARAGARNPYAAREPYVTGSLGGRKPSPRGKAGAYDEDEFLDE